MICERILGNIAERQPPAAVEVDDVPFQWTEAQRRFLKKRSRAGRSVGIMLPAGTVLRDGDVLHEAPGVVVVARLEHAALLAVPATDRGAWGRLLYELGSRHEPVEVRDDRLLLTARDDLRAWLDRMGIDYALVNDRFRPQIVAGMRWTVREEQEVSAGG